MSQSPETRRGSAGTDHEASLIEQETARANVDEERATSNQRVFTSRKNLIIAVLFVVQKGLVKPGHVAHGAD